MKVLFRDRVPTRVFHETLTSVSIPAALPLRRPMSDIIRGQPQVFVDSIKFGADLNHNSQILSASSFYPPLLEASTYDNNVQMLELQFSKFFPSLKLPHVCNLFII